MIAAVPAVFSAWLDLPDDRAPRDAFASVRLAVSGAAALPDEIAAAMQERFGVDVREGYGLTEASPIVTTAAIGGPVRPGSIGPPLPGVEVRAASTPTAPTCSRATRARSGCGARTCSRATGTTPRPPRG